LDHNQLSSIPESISKLKNLEYLSLNYNQPLKSLPSSLSKLTSLSHLYIFGCDNLEYSLKEVVNSKNTYESVDVLNIQKFLRKMQLIAIQSSLVGLCINVIALNISNFKNLAVIPIELKEKINKHLTDEKFKI